MRYNLPWLDNDWGEAFIEREDKMPFWYLSYAVGPASRQWKPITEENAEWLTRLSQLCTSG